MGVPVNIASWLMALDLGGSFVILMPHSRRTLNAIRMAGPQDTSHHEKIRGLGFTLARGFTQGDVKSPIAWICFFDILVCALNKCQPDRYPKARTEGSVSHPVKPMVFIDDLTSVTCYREHTQEIADIVAAFNAVFGTICAVAKFRAVSTTGPLHRAIQERDDGTHESALYLESLSQPQHPFGVIPASVDDIPTMTKTCKSPYGELSLASGDVACEVSRQDSKRPYGEPSLFNDIEHDCSRMSGSELRQTRQYLEHSSAYSHLQDSGVKTCLEHCSTLNYTERDSVRKCLVAHKVLGDEENTPSTAGSATSKENCMFVEDPIDAWVQNDHTRGADRHTPFVHPNFVEDTADPEHTPEVVGMLNRGLNKLAETLNWENWALKSGHYPSTSENLPPSKANTLEEADDDDGELPQGSLKDLTRAAMLRMPYGQRRKFLIAEAKELKAIKDLKVIEGMVPIPKGVRPIATRFVYATKDPVA
jgi:hypothetical protein